MGIYVFFLSVVSGPRGGGALCYHSPNLAIVHSSRIGGVRGIQALRIWVIYYNTTQLHSAACAPPTLLSRLLPLSQTCRMGGAGPVRQFRTGTDSRALSSPHRHTHNPRPGGGGEEGWERISYWSHLRSFSRDRQRERERAVVVELSIHHLRKIQHLE